MIGPEAQDLALVESSIGEDLNSWPLIESSRIVEGVGRSLAQVKAEALRVARVVVAARAPRDWAPFDPDHWGESKARANREALLDRPTVERLAE